MDKVRKVYLYSFAWLLSGASWLAVNLFLLPVNDHTPCLFKNLTTLPCPSCGTTRAWMLLLKGEVTDALWTNPFGIVSGFLAIACGLALVKDIAFEKRDFPQLVKKVDQMLRRKVIYLPLASIILINWCWSIFKGL